MLVAVSVSRPAPDEGEERRELLGLVGVGGAVDAVGLSEGERGAEPHVERGVQRPRHEPHPAELDDELRDAVVVQGPEMLVGVLLEGRAHRLAS